MASLAWPKSIFARVFIVGGGVAHARCRRSPSSSCEVIAIVIRQIELQRRPFGMTTKGKLSYSPVAHERDQIACLLGAGGELSGTTGLGANRKHWASGN
jgi:hypothetical protein